MIFRLRHQKLEHWKTTRKNSISDLTQVVSFKQAKLKKKEVKKKTDKKILKNSKSVNKNNKKIVDICTILEKCSIDEISKYLIKQGKSKKFPDITTME